MGSSGLTFVSNQVPSDIPRLIPGLTIVGWFALRKLRSIQNRVLMSHRAVPRKVAPPVGGNGRGNAACVSVPE